MMRSWLAFPLVCLLAVITGCSATGGVRDGDDTTGSLGVDKPRSPASIYVEMGVAYMRDGQLAVALKKLKTALKKDLKHAQAHNVIALVYERLGNNELAAKHFDQAARYDSKDPYIRNARGSFLCRRGDYALALDEFKQALDNPLYETPWVALGNAGLCSEKTGDKEMAERYYRRGLTMNKYYAPNLLQMAKLSFDKAKHLVARGYLERYHEVSSGTAASLWLGVQIERLLGSHGMAKEYGRELQERFPDALEVQYLYQRE